MRNHLDEPLTTREGVLQAVTHVLALEASDTPSPAGGGVDATGEDASAQAARAA